MLNLTKNEIACSKGDILDYYRESCKQENDFMVGLEYERLSLDATTKRNAPYENLKKIIEYFASIRGWGILRDGAGVVIGAMASGETNSPGAGGGYGAVTSISLEPGGQFELSLEKKKSIGEIESDSVQILTLLDKIGDAHGVKFVPIGNTPYSTYRNINIVPKDRYLIMADYLPAQGRFSPVMMRETAGVQVNLDYRNEEDALLKLRLAAKMSPFLTGFFANSPMRAGKTLQYKSFRTLAWKYTDAARCGLFYKNLLKNRACIGFEDYVDAILNVPMLFFERGAKKIEVRGKINFKEFLESGFEGHSATMQDYILHSSLTFPDVRLKNCIEIRNHDSHKLPLALAICAFYKGVMYSDTAMDEAAELLEGVENINELGFLAAKHGLDFEIPEASTAGGVRNGASAAATSKFTARKITTKLFEIAHKNIGRDEQKYLEKPLEMLVSGRAPIDEFNLEQFF